MVVAPLLPHKSAHSATHPTPTPPAHPLNLPTTHSTRMKRSEHIRAGLQTITSLILLGGAPFLQQHGGDLAQLLAGYVGTVNERGMLLLLPPLDLLLVMFPADAPALLAPALQRLLALLLAGGEPTAVVANSLGVLARLLLQNPGAFQQLVVATAAASGGGGGGPAVAATPEQVVHALTEIWVDKFDSITNPLARKLSALALCALLALPSKSQLAAAPAIVGHVTAAWHEVEASGDGDADGTLYCSPIYCTPRGDDGGWGGESLAMSEEAAGEAQRREAVSARRWLETGGWLVFGRQEPACLRALMLTNLRPRYSTTPGHRSRAPAAAQDQRLPPRPAAGGGGGARPGPAGGAGGHGGGPGAAAAGGAGGGGMSVLHAHARFACAVACSY